MQSAMLEIRRADERGSASFGWLNSRHTFSFGQYRDAQQQGFSDLLVINDDQVAPRGGFPTHSHHDMEIFSYVLQGALEHADSMGTGSVIRPGDVQMMSAGSGISHSEYNHSDTELVHFLQIWIVPNRLGVVPRYQQVHFTTAQKRGRFQTIISPTGEDGSLSVYQDTRVYAGLFDDAEEALWHLPPKRHAYVHVAQGELTINGQHFSAGDGARVRQSGDLHFSGGQQAHVLVFDLRPHELPRL